MNIIITIACLIIALCFLIVLGVIDMRIRLLPNKYVAGFFLTGIIFHASNDFIFSSPLDIFLGIIAGGGLLLAIRYIANKICKIDTLGLGDVKLMGAAGAWLGIDYIFLALSLGALAGLAHGFIYGQYKKTKTGEKTNFLALSIPAGPGFIFGIIIVGISRIEMLINII